MIKWAVGAVGVDGLVDVLNVVEVEGLEDTPGVVEVGFVVLTEEIRWNGDKSAGGLVTMLSCSLS